MTHAAKRIFLCLVPLLPLFWQTAAAQSSALEQLGAGPVAAAPAAPAAPVPAEPAPAAAGGDVTAEYDALFLRPGAGLSAEDERRLAGYKFILVPGLFACVDKSGLPLPGSNKPPKPKPHFAEQVPWLKSIGAEYEILKLKTESSVRDNVPIIAAAVKASGKPVMIIAESKGGLDVLEALLKDASVPGRVKGIVMSQAPFRGTPVADFIVETPALRGLVAGVLEKVNGSIASMVELGTADRAAYMAENGARIAELTRTIPMLSVATWKDPSGKETDTALRPLRNLMLKRGLKNDGLVAIGSAIFPGTDYVKIEGPDHGAPIKKTKKIIFDRATFAKAVLKMLLDRQPR
jgi:hypothetical protein